jgi:hypothetical protein
MKLLVMKHGLKNSFIPMDGRWTVTKKSLFRSKDPFTHTHPQITLSNNQIKKHEKVKSFSCFSVLSDAIAAYS